MKNNKIKITQVKSSIGYKKNAKATLIALGLKKNNQSIIKEDTPSVRGMIKSIEFMLRIEEL